MTDERAPPTPPAAREVTVEAHLDAAPRTVWRALAEPDLLAAWLAPAEAGVEVSAVEIDPPRAATYEWREAGQGGPPLRSTVTFTVEAAEGGGARLRIVHAAPAVLAPRAMSLSAGTRGRGGCLRRSAARPLTPARARPTSLRWAA